MKKNNIISDWLDKHGTVEVDLQVQKEAREILGLEQTAVEFLFERLWNEPRDKFTWYAILNKAKELYKNQITQAFSAGEHQQGFEGEAELYYKETYGSTE